MIDDFPTRFPTIWEACRTVGLDPTQRLAAGRARRALPLGRRRRRPRRRDDAAAPVGVRRDRVQRRARREPARVELAARRPRVRPSASCRAIVAGKAGPTRPARWPACSTVAPSRRSTPSADPVVLRKEQVTPPDALRGAVQRTMSADCGVVRDADGAAAAPAETLADLAALAEDLPAREIATYEVINLLRVVARDRRGRARHARSRAARTRAPTSRTPTTRWLGRSSSTATRAPRVRRRCPALAVRASRRMSDFDPPTSVVVARSSRPRWPKTSACSATSRRSRASARTRPRPRVFVAREEGVLAGTALVDETFRQVDDERRGRLEPARRRRGRARRRDRRGRRARCARSSPASGSRSTSCATARVSRRSRAATCAPRAARRASSTPARRCPGLRAVQRAAVRAGGGFNHRDSLSTAVLIKDNHLAALGLTQGGRAGAGALADAASSRSSATRSTRSSRRATPASTSCCSTT